MKRSLLNALPKIVLGIAPMVAMGLPAVMTAPASYAQESTDKAKEETKQSETKSEASQSESTKSDAKSEASPSESTKAGAGSEKSGTSPSSSASKSGSSQQSGQASGAASSTNQAGNNNESSSKTGSDSQSTSGAQSATRRQANRAQSSTSDSADRTGASGSASGSASGDLQLNQPSSDDAAEGNASARTRSNAREGAANAQNRTGASARARTGANADSDDAAESTSRTRRSADRTADADQTDTADDARSDRSRTRDRSARDIQDRDDTDVRSRRDARANRDMDRDDRDDADNARGDRRDATRDRTDRRDDRRDDRREDRSDDRREDRSDRRFSQDRDVRAGARVNRDNRDIRSRFRSVNDFGLALSFGNGGLIVNDIYRTSVLRRYGFRQGDVIVSINGNPVRSQDDFIEYIVVEDVDRVPVVVMRDGQEETLYVVTEELYATDSGVDVRADYQSSSAAYLGVSLDRSYQQGARVSQVTPGSPAEEAGIERGDVITAINGQAIRTPNDVTRIIQQMQPGDAIEVELTHQVTDVTEVVLGQQRGRAAVRSTYEESYDDTDVRYSRDRVDVEVTQPDVDVYDRGAVYGEGYQDRVRTRGSLDVDSGFDEGRVDVEGRGRVGGAIQRDGDASGRARGGIRGIFRGGR